MNLTDRPRLSEEEKEAMFAQYGNSKRETVKPLTMLMALILARQDITAFAFICEVIGGVMESAIGMAQKVQESHHQEVLH